MSGFIPFSYRDGQPEPWEYLEAGALGTVAVGTALTVSAGVLAKATGEARPSYICMYGGMVEAGDVIPVIRVHEETVFETELSVASASAAVGAKYTIDTTGTMITATTGGPAELVSFDGTAAGDTVRVRFARE
nr:hypothetical protein [Oscillospiraceae bacterium]